jgi:hypothetical protein
MSSPVDVAEVLSVDMATAMLGNGAPKEGGPQAGLLL